MLGLVGRNWAETSPNTSPFHALRAVQLPLPLRPVHRTRFCVTLEVAVLLCRTPAQGQLAIQTRWRPARCRRHLCPGRPVIAKVHCSPTAACLSAVTGFRVPACWRHGGPRPRRAFAPACSFSSYCEAPISSPINALLLFQPQPSPPHNKKLPRGNPSPHAAVLPAAACDRT